MCAVTRLWVTLPTCTTKWCKAGSTTTDASTGPGCIHFSDSMNEYLVRWAKRKYKRLHGHDRRTRAVAGQSRETRGPKLFAHWRLGVRPDGWTMGAVCRLEVHVRFVGGPAQWIRLLWVWSALMMGGQQGAGEQRVRDPQLVRSSFCCVIAQPSASCVGNGFGNETRRNGRDGVECGVMAWTVEKS